MMTLNVLQDLATPLAVGSTVRLKLRFERQGLVEIGVPVSGPR